MVTVGQRVKIKGIGRTYTVVNSKGGLVTLIDDDGYESTTWDSEGLFIEVEPSVIVI